MSTHHDATSVDRLQMRLAQQEPREQFHYLMRILPESMKAELRAEQQLQGERESQLLRWRSHRHAKYTPLGPPVRPTGRPRQVTSQTVPTGALQQSGTHNGRRLARPGSSDGKTAAMVLREWGQDAWPSVRPCYEPCKICHGNGHSSR